LLGLSFNAIAIVDYYGVKKSWLLYVLEMKNYRF